jgi:hypothetical protein
MMSLSWPPSQTYKIANRDWNAPGPEEDNPLDVQSSTSTTAIIDHKLETSRTATSKHNGG